MRGLLALVGQVPSLVAKLDAIRSLKARMIRAAILYGLAGVFALVGLFFLFALIDRLLTRWTEDSALSAGILAAILLVVALILVLVQSAAAAKAKREAERRQRAGETLAVTAAVANEVAKRGRAMSSAANELAYRAGISAKTVARRATIPGAIALAVVGATALLKPRFTSRVKRALGRAEPTAAELRAQARQLSREERRAARQAR